MMMMTVILRMVTLPSSSALWSLVKDVDHEPYYHNGDNDDDDGDFEDGYSAIVILTVVSG